jgi:DNA-directed RNA polymerase specialized sigma24 family protein
MFGKEVAMLSSDLSFKELLDRVRIGEERACQELVEKYAGEIRRVIRIRLREPLLRSTIDTTDIYQWVLMDFFARMKLGEYQFDLPTDLVKLLLTMARHKFLNHAR